VTTFCGSEAADLDLQQLRCSGATGWTGSIPRWSTFGVRSVQPPLKNQLVVPACVGDMASSTRSCALRSAERETRRGDEPDRTGRFPHQVGADEARVEALARTATVSAPRQLERNMSQGLVGQRCGGVRMVFEKAVPCRREWLMAAVTVITRPPPISLSRSRLVSKRSEIVGGEHELEPIRVLRSA